MIDVISKIARLPSKFVTFLIGDQKQIEDTPFAIQAGKLNYDGEVENAAPPFKTFEYIEWSVAAGVDDAIIQRITNKRYRRMYLGINKVINGVSFDVKAKFQDGTPTGVTFLRDDRGALRWSEDAITGTDNFSMDGEIPVGINLQIRMDNNDGVAACTGSLRTTLYDPVR